MKRTTSVLGEVFKERIHQEKKWGQQDHMPFVWITILGEEYGEVCRGALEAEFGSQDLANYREELIHTAAVAVAAIECLDRNSIKSAETIENIEEK